MALSKSISMDTGIVLQNAYARIESVNGNKNNISISLYYYVSHSAADQGKRELHIDRFEFVPSTEDDSHNFIKQGYEHIKSLPNFKDAVDV